MKTITITHEERQRLIAAGISRQSIYNWTRRGINPSLATMFMVKEVLGRDPWSNPDRRAPPRDLPPLG